MVRRSKDWNEGLAKDLRSPAFAREFLMAAIEEGVPLQVALGKVIRAYGVQEFAERTGIAGPNLVRILRAGYNPTQETLNLLLEPFGLRLGVVPVVEKPRKRTA